MMKSMWVVPVTLLPFTFAGCAGAVWGNLFVLAITVGIFVGTLSLGRTQTKTGRSADQSSSQS